MADHMLSTVDNPYNPFTQFDDWYAYDSFKGYHTSSFLARITNYSSDLSEEDQSLAIEQAIEEIIRENVSGLFIRVSDPNGNSESENL